MGMAGVQNRTAFLHSEGLLALKKNLGRFYVFLTHIIHQKSSALRIIKFTCYLVRIKIYLLPGRSCCSVTQLCPSLCEPMN